MSEQFSFEANELNQEGVGKEAVKRALGDEGCLGCETIEQVWRVMRNLDKGK